MATYTIGDGSGGTLTIFCAALAPIVPASTPTDGTNVMTRLFDLDSGVGSEYNMGFSLRLSASGGSVEGGTATNPVRVDPTGTTTQPISGTVSISGGVSISGTVTVAGTVAATQSGTWTVQQGGAWTVAATQSGAWTVAATQSGAWTVAATQSGVWSVTQSGVWTVTQSGTWTVATNADATIGGTSAPAKLLLVGGKTSDGTPQYQPLPLAAAGASVIVSGTVTANQGGAPWSVNLTQIAGAGLTLGQAAMASSIPVVIASNQSAVPVSQSGTWNIATVSAVTSITNPVAVTVADGADVTLGAQADSAAATDTATASLMGLVKRLLQRVTTFIAQLPTALTDAGNFKVAIKESAVPLAVSASGVFTVQTSAAAPLLIAGSDYALRAPSVRAWKVDPLGIGQVALASALPAGANTIGSVTLGAGTAAIGSVTVSAGTLAQLPAALSARGNLQVALAESTVPVSVTAAAPLTVQTAASNPLLLAGSDYALRTPAVRALKVDALGTAQVNVVSLAGITPSFGSGATDAGTRRVVIASDQATLKVDGSAVTQPVTGAVTVTNPAPLATKEAGPVTVLTGVNAPLVMGGSDYAWRMPAARPLRVDALGAAHVVVDGGTIASIAPFNNRTAAATLASMDSVEVLTTGCGTALLALTGSAVNIGVTIEGTTDGVNWIGADAYDSNKGPAARAFYPGGNEITITSFVAANYVVPCAGFIKVRARVSTYTSGAATFSWSAGAFERAVISHSTASVSMVANGRTTAPTQGLLVMGQTSDFTAQYRPLPLSASGGTVIVSGDVGTVTTVTTITNAVTVVGAAASGATKSGNPVQMGGVFNTTQPTVTTGQAVELQATARGALIIATGVDTFTVDTELPAAAALADGAAATPTTPTIGVIPLLYNNATMDRQRGVQQIQLFNLTPRTTGAAQVSSVLTNHNSRGLVISVNVTAMTAGKTLLLNVLGRNVTDAFNWRLCDDLTITAVGVWVVEISPGASGTTGTVNDIVKTKSGGLPRAFFIILTASDATNWTYSAYADLLL